MTRTTSAPAQSPAIVLNGESRALPAATSALELVAEVTGRQLREDGTPADGGRLGVALAVDGEVIRRGAWSDFTLADGHTVDIVTAVQGG
ncbi:sulfur carrier protein ThiS [Brevibacterium spongiae]|uniref:Sulfur carrier protein ThiS n=1 Tax=Brevibacterium spongiae TaxID=2909672 RepID=A0ABY5SSG9_9MICO|nr:sulfur carrier protein ThiS [Brevibacterium spongiae]UVI37513.1 sulfur carrier protein ThiS [Brevibacterium spongiae]